MCLYVRCEFIIIIKLVPDLTGPEKEHWGGKQDMTADVYKHHKDILLNPDCRSVKSLWTTLIRLRVLSSIGAREKMYQT